MKIHNQSVKIFETLVTITAVLALVALPFFGMLSSVSLLVAIFPLILLTLVAFTSPTDLKGRSGRCAATAVSWALALCISLNAWTAAVVTGLANGWLSYRIAAWVDKTCPVAVNGNIICSGCGRPLQKRSFRLFIDWLNTKCAECRRTQEGEE